MPTARREFGDRAEALAGHFFAARGFRVVVRNYRTRYGELDLIIEKDHCLHVIEVKARSSAVQSPFEAITQKKRVCLSRAMDLWLQQHQEYAGYHYQIDAFCLWREANDWKTEWLEGI